MSLEEPTILDLMLEALCKACPLKRKCIDEELGIRRLAFRCPISRFHARLSGLAYDLAYELRRRIIALRGRVSNDQ